MSITAISLSSQSPAWMAASRQGTRSCSTEPASSTTGNPTQASTAAATNGPNPSRSSSRTPTAITVATTALRTSSAERQAPDPRRLFAHVYSVPTPQLDEQAALLLDEMSREVEVS